MSVSKLRDYVISLFDDSKLNPFRDEWDFSTHGSGEVSKVGYATNLTPEVVELAIENRVDLIMTHHDAWDFLHGMKEHCTNRMQEHGISHCFFHLPLDDADFGTNVTLASRLGLKKLEKSHLYNEAFHCGRIGESTNDLDFDSMKNCLETVLEEPVRAWKFHDRPIRRVCVVTGGGSNTSDIMEAVNKGCDAYITGEKVLYTVEYARFVGIDLFVGSHTGTEVLGVESLASKVKIQFGDIDVIRLKEDHLE